jgi:hypothetical protein
MSPPTIIIAAHTPESCTDGSRKSEHRLLSDSSRQGERASILFLFRKSHAAGGAGARDSSFDGFAVMSTPERKRP